MTNKHTSLTKLLIVSIATLTLSGCIIHVGGKKNSDTDRGSVSFSASYSASASDSGSGSGTTSGGKAGHMCDSERDRDSDSEK